MKKLFAVLSIIVAGHYAQAQSVNMPDSYTQCYGVDVSPASASLNAANQDDQNYTIELVVDGNDVYMTVTGTEFNPEFYYISDMQQNILQQGVPEVINNTMHVVFNANIPAGTYMITGKTRNNSFTHAGQHY